MYQYQGVQDTIAAVVTPPGAGGVAIVRLSGPGSEGVLARLFTPAPAAWGSHELHHGYIVDGDGARVDEVLAVVMRAPRSYTAEDVVEINTHGGAAAARTVLDLCLAAGARPAEPGEFTKRAFLNGRIDLAQAEAVADLVSARTGAALRAAARQVSGDLSREVQGLRERLMDLLVSLEALLNFPEDDTDRGQADTLRASAGEVLARLRALLATARGGALLREGVRLAIVGRTNVGKSSLFNALLRQDRAIVADLAGTTRDTLEGIVDIHGIPMVCVDTAGVLAPRDRVEEEALRRSRETLEAADLVLLVLDRSCPLSGDDQALMAVVRARNTVVALNKSDLPRAWDEALLPFADQVAVSALTGEGLAGLEDLLARCAAGGSAPEEGGGLALTNARHVAALRRAEESLAAAVEVLGGHGALDIAAAGFKQAVCGMDALTGRDVDPDLVERIFSGFCIGK